MGFPDLSKRALTVIGILVGLVVIVVGGWYVFVRSDAPDAPDAESAREALEGSQATTTTPPAATDDRSRDPRHDDRDPLRRHGRRERHMDG